MDCPVSTYSFLERLTECGLYGFSFSQVLMLVALALVGGAYACGNTANSYRQERDEKSDRF